MARCRGWKKILIVGLRPIQARWFTQNASGMNVEIEDISESVSALALQGPTSARLLKTVVEELS